MCKNCGTAKCPGCKKKSRNTEIASLQSEISELKDTINIIQTNAKFLLCGHPILKLQEAGDIACFDIAGTGLGSDCWEGWAVCDGSSHPKVNGTGNLVTPNLIDRFPVQAGGIYTVGDTGGENTHALTTAELAAHTHVVVDPGHTHAITDPGHNHTVTDPGHSHTLTTDDPGDHQHTVPNIPLNIGGLGGSGAMAATSPVTFGGSGLAGAHTHTGATNTVDANVTIDSNQTDITIVTDQTDITLNNAGSGTAHENRPPYYALLFVIKL